MICGHREVVSNVHVCVVTNWRTETKECRKCGRVHVRVVDCESDQIVDETRYSKAKYWNPR